MQSHVLSSIEHSRLGSHVTVLEFPLGPKPRLMRIEGTIAAAPLGMWEQNDGVERQSLVWIDIPGGITEGKSPVTISQGGVRALSQATNHLWAAILKVTTNGVVLPVNLDFSDRAVTLPHWKLAIVIANQSFVPVADRRAQTDSDKDYHSADCECQLSIWYE